MLAAFEVSSRDTFVARAERKLDRALDVPIQLVNGGVRGYGTDQSYLYYRERGRDLAPDLVVFMHSANDVRNNMTLHRMRRLFGKPAFALEADGELELQGSPVPEYPLCSAYSMDQAFAVARRDGLLARAFCAIEVNAADHSALFTAASFAVQRSPALVRFIQRLTNASSAAAGASWRLAAPGVAHAQSVASPAIRVTLRLIEALAREAENSGAGFLLMISDADLQRLGSTRLDDAGVSWRPVRISVMKELGPDIHFRNDGHWNAYGHQLVGDLLAQVLLERIEEDLERRRSLSGGASPAR
jgi:lysophospholipase L1-like esterase